MCDTSLLKNKGKGKISLITEGGNVTKLWNFFLLLKMSPCNFEELLIIFAYGLR